MKTTKFNPSKSNILVGTGIIGIVIIAGLCISAIWRSPTVEPEEIPTPTVEETANSVGVGFIDSEENGPASMSSTPAPESTYENTENWVIEDTSAFYEDDVAYLNEKVVTFQYNDKGDTISFGLGSSSDNSRIYLNPVASISQSQNRQVGFYITSERCELEATFNDYQDIDTEQNKGHYSYLLQDAYDYMIPADGTNLWWRNDLYADGQKKTGTTLSCRAVDLTGGGSLIAFFKVQIEYTEVGYAITEITNTDCLATGELDQEDYNTLLEHAYSLVTNETFEPSGVGQARIEFLAFGEKGADLYNSRIEHLGTKTYFYQLLTPGGVKERSAYYRNLLEISDVYAVTLNTALGHSLTLYYASECGTDRYKTIVQNKLRSFTDDEGNITLPDDVLLPNTDPVTSKGLIFFGYDFFNPITHSDSYFTN